MHKKKIVTALSILGDINDRQGTIGNIKHDKFTSL